MLSAVEAAAAANAYAVAHHHNPFAITMPSTTAALTAHHQQQQIQATGQLHLEYNSLLGSSPLINSHLQHHLSPAGSLTSHFLSAAAAAAAASHHHPQLHHPSGIYLPPPPTSFSLTGNSLLPSPSSTSSTYSSSSSNSCPSPTSTTSALIPSVKSPRLSTDSGISLTSPDIPIMSSTEFVRPHPKQPRFNSANNSNNNGSSIPKTNCKLSNEVRGKYSAEPQTGPVNLVTNNNNNCSSENSNSKINNDSNNRTNSPIEVEINGSPTLKLNNSSTAENQNDLMASLYSQKLPFGSPVVSESSAAAQIAAAYQFNYPHLYARGAAIYSGSPLYPGHPSLSTSSRQSLHNGRPETAQFSPFHLSPSLQYPSSGISPPSQNPPHTQSSPSLKSSLGTTNLLNNSQLSCKSNNNSNNTSSVLSQQQQHQQLPQSAQKSPSSMLPALNSQQNSLHQIHVPHSASLPVNLSEQQRSLQDKDLHHKALINNNNNLTNDKQQSVSPNSVAGFKVPSGKEGSLKHRFLTRPPGSERSDPKIKQTPISTSILRTSSTAPSNFTKGSCIELSNGILRKVEDMRTEDFIQSAEKSPHHQLADSTVVKISNTPISVIITFSYDKNHSKADVEVSLEHPFFVYGQGWASCNPELTLQSFGLKCQRLQVGDVCISLISRSNCLASSHQQNHQNNDAIPQNLSQNSRQQKLYTTKSHQYHYPLHHHQQQSQMHHHHHHHHHHQHSQIASTRAHLPYELQYDEAISRPQATNPLQNGNIFPAMPPYTSLPESRFLHPQLPLSLTSKACGDVDFKFSPPPPPLNNNDRAYYLGNSQQRSHDDQSTYVRPPQNSPQQHQSSQKQECQDLSANATDQSRKRRWSDSKSGSSISDENTVERNKSPCQSGISSCSGQKDLK